MDKILKNAPYKMLYKTSLDDTEFHVLTPERGRPKIYENIHLVPLCTTIRAKTEGKYKNIKDLLSYQFIKNILNHLRLKIPFSKNEKKVRNDKS